MGRLTDIAKGEAPVTGDHNADSTRPRNSCATEDGLTMTGQAADLRASLSTAALAELPPEDATCPWWRVSIVGLQALNIDLETRSAWTVADWGRFARRHYGPDATVVARARLEEAAAEARRQRVLALSPATAPATPCMWTIPPQTR